MFHAAAWGLPFAGAMSGTKFVYSAVNDGKVLCRLMNEEKVTHSAGVPTVWLAMFQHMDATGEKPEHLKMVTIGGSAAPRAMVERLMKMGIRVGHAWGMTETSPIGTMGAPPGNWDELSFEEQVDLVCKQGRVPFGVELRVVDDEGAIQPRDGESSGRLQIRGPWVIKRYFQAEEDAADADGWFDTGDVAVIHPCGTMQITDRSKDVIKSGGEWISSVELENAAVGCAGVAEAAAIGIYHPKWDERPLLLVVRKPGIGCDRGADPRSPQEPRRQMVAAGRDPVRRQPAPHRDRQAAQDRACASNIRTTNWRPSRPSGQAPYLYPRRLSRGAMTSMGRIVAAERRLGQRVALAHAPAAPVARLRPLREAIAELAEDWTRARRGAPPSPTRSTSIGSSPPRPRRPATCNCSKCGAGRS